VHNTDIKFLVIKVVKKLLHLIFYTKEMFRFFHVFQVDNKSYLRIKEVGLSSTESALLNNVGDSYPKVE